MVTWRRCFHLVPALTLFFDCSACLKYDLRLGGYLPFEEPFPEDVEDGTAEDRELSEIVIEGKFKVLLALIS